MFRPGTLAFLSSGTGQYFVKTLVNDGGETLALQHNEFLTRQRVVARGNNGDGLIGTRLSRAVRMRMDHVLEQDLRAHPHDVPIGAMLLYRITEPLLSAARRDEVVLAGIDIYGMTPRFVRIEPAMIEQFDWDFVLNEARHLPGRVMYVAVRAFQPDEWKRVLASRGLVRSATKQEPKKTNPSRAAVIECFRAMFREWRAGQRPRPKYEAAKRACKAATGASERQLRDAWRLVADDCSTK